MVDSKPWYKSHGIWGAIFAAVFGLVQLVVAVGAQVSAMCGIDSPGCVWRGLAAVGWGNWALTLAGLAVGIGLAVSRWKAGADEADTTTARLTGGAGSARGLSTAGALVVALAGAALALLVAAAGCGPASIQRGSTEDVFASIGVELLPAGCMAAHMGCQQLAMKADEGPERDAALLGCDFARAECMVGYELAKRRLEEARARAEAAAD